jgi:uncharacterized protein (DUF2236 family)
MRGGRHISGELSGSENVAWKVNCEIVLLLGWGRAILLQFAHPLVAAGVDEHSRFQNEPHGHWRRLQGTLDAMLTLTFGTPDKARAAAERINAIHDRIHGSLVEPAGPFAASTWYSAHDPELLRWVYATLVDSFLQTYERYVGTLTPAERDRYCAAASQIAPLLGIPDDYLPASADAVGAYMESMFASGQVVVTRTARRLARALLAPPIPPAVWPAGLPARWLGRLVTIGQLPVEVRAAYGFRWGRQHEWLFRLWSALVRLQIPLLPTWVRHWPVARAAARRGEVTAGAR